MSACKFLGRFLKKVASKPVIISGDFNVDATTTLSPKPQIFWGCVPPDYCVLPESDNFSYIGPLSSTSNIDNVVASFGSHEVKVLKEGFYSDHLPISSCFYSFPLLPQNTESNWFPTIFYAIVLCCNKVKRTSQLSSLPTWHK